MEEQIAKLTKQQIQAKIQEEFNQQVDLKLKKQELIDKYMELQKQKEQQNIQIEEAKKQEVENQEISVEEIPVEISRSRVQNGIYMSYSTAQKDIQKRYKKQSKCTQIVLVSLLVVSVMSVVAYISLNKKE